MKRIICYKCGKESDSDSAFCGFCGADFKSFEARVRSKINNQDKTSKSNLIQCPDCKKEISSQARACPGCGRPTEAGIAEDKKARRRKRGNVQGLGFLLMLLSFFMIFVSPLLGGPMFFMGLIILIAGFFI